jgi:phosphoribosyl 1,2-cyclic phosphate phosphodiesterase
VKITFLGTGTSQGIPVIACPCEVCTSLDFRDKRLRTSILLEHNNTSVVFDTGPDFRQQMLRERVKKLDAVVFTHEHKEAMPIFARSNVLTALKKEFSYVFAEYQYPGIPKLDLRELTNTPFKIKDIELTPIDVMHYKLPVFGFRIGDFTYITDANFISETELEKIKGSKIVVLNALQKEDHVSHYNLQQAIDVLTSLQPEKAYLIHLGHRMGTHAETAKLLPDFIEIAYDGLTLTL